MANCRHFVNADLIAAGLSPLAPESQLVAASRLFLREIEACIARQQDFAFETTLASRTHLHLIDRLRQTGWRVDLVYLTLPSVEMSDCGWPNASSWRPQHSGQRHRKALSKKSAQSATGIQRSR
ncbi:MAG: hypothetical protein PHE55_02175 [Methylococcaceae bacterium]|nr:hypothetical protein [Methylococcaceae bacterium]